MIVHPQAGDRFRKKGWGTRYAVVREVHLHVLDNMTAIHRDTWIVTADDGSRWALRVNVDAVDGVRFIGVPAPGPPHSATTSQ